MTCPTADARERGRFICVNGIRLHYMAQGNGPPVVLLHGFPEYWYSWRHQLPVLAAAGFRAIAPDLRGYNFSEKPAGVEAYRLDKLVNDIAGLIEQIKGPATVVGHDWGGVVAWALAMHRPDLVGRLAVLNAPHPGAYLREVRRIGQLFRSWYALFFQLPRIPEALIRMANFWMVGRALRNGPAQRSAFSEADIDHYKKALAEPGALTAGINYYRASFRHLGRTAAAIRPVSAPTLLIWGMQDRFLSVRLTEGLERWVPSLRVERIAEAAHWVQNEAPDAVNRLLVDFLNERTATRSD